MSLVKAIHDLLAFEKQNADSYTGIPQAEYERFIELDRQVTMLAAQCQLTWALPQRDKLARLLDKPDRHFAARHGEKPVQFIGGTNLPGDWDHGLFLTVPEFWRDELQTLLSLAKENPKRNVGRPKKTEKDSAAKVIAALCAWHKYENGSVMNYEPASNRKLAEKYGLSANALTRFLKNKGGHRKYAAACQKGTIGGLLAKWSGEAAERHADLRPEEYGREEDE